MKVKKCPCCGSKPFHTLGYKLVRALDMVQCLVCDLSMEGDYEPYSALIKWNKRVGD